MTKTQALELQLGDQVLVKDDMATVQAEVKEVTAKGGVRVWVPCRSFASNYHKWYPFWHVERDTPGEPLHLWWAR